MYLGVMLARGIGSEARPAAAAAPLTRACRSQALACVELARVFDVWPLGPNLAQQFVYLDRACDLGHRESCSEVEHRRMQKMFDEYRDLGSVAEDQAAQASRTEAPNGSECCMTCTSGHPCGNSCISWRYTCHQAPGCACW